MGCLRCFVPGFRMHLRSKRQILRKHLIPVFGRMKLDQIETGRIEALKTKLLAEGLCKKTVNNVLAVLRKLLSTAKAFGKLEHIPEVSWLRAPKPEIDFLSFEEAEQLASRAEPGRW